MAKKKKERSFSSFVNNPMDFPLIITIFLLLSIGLVMVLSASSPSALSESGNSYAFFSKQLKLAILGCIMMFIISKIDYRFYQKFTWKTYVVSIILLLLVLLFGTKIKGGKRWIFITSSFSFQPSELVKMFMIIFYAGVLSANRDKLGLVGKGFLQHIAYIVPIAILLVLEPHVSVTIVIVGVVSIMMLVAGCKFKHFAVAGLIGAIPILGFIMSAEYRMKRILTFFNPWEDVTGDSWQVVQSLYAIGSGGLFGAGLGESKQKFLYIPEPHNDFIFSILAEELGFLGCTVVLVLFGIFIYRGIMIAKKAPDMFGSLLAVGITSLVAIQVIINVAVDTATMPATGMPLPFFSYGGTALFLLLCEMGILLNISRAGRD